LFAFACARSQSGRRLPVSWAPIEAANERPYLIRDDQDVGGFAGKTGFLSVSRGCRNA
jgi:hypothetical protein